MTLKNFLIGTSASFGLAWLLMIVVPFVKMSDPEPVPFDEVADERTGVYFHKTSGRVEDGFNVYQANGCALCHTQVIRPTYAGTDMWRSDWAGLAADEVRGDTRRESTVFDYERLDYAPIGVTRIGPDLSNIGTRVAASYTKSAAEAEAWLYRHLYNPRLDPARGWSVCPSMPFLFEHEPIRGQRSEIALELDVEPGIEIVPGRDARALVSYLLSLRHDDPIPASMNRGAEDTAAPVATDPS